MVQGTPDDTNSDYPGRLDQALTKLFETKLEARLPMLERLCNEHADLAGDLRAAHDAHRLARESRARESDEAVPVRIGPYRLLEELGSGGMGTVYLAKQSEPVRRLVALKVIKAGLDTREVLARFEREQQALASMDHSNIAKVFDAGRTDASRPYFAMEYVPGLPLTLYCDEKQLTVTERMRLFMQVCHGVQHAHQKGVIHRDLKATNILVREENDRGVPKIIDFGLARAVDYDTVRSLYTERDRALGTPEYMSPEQAGLSPLDLDTRTDIYSLGCVLYELLVGELPFPSPVLRHAGDLEMKRMIREDQPPSPSKRVSVISEDTRHWAHLRRTAPRSLHRSIRGDLDWMTMKALEKDRTRRYATAAALAEDVERHLTHLPVHAGPPSAAYRFRRWVRRHRGKVAAAVTIFGIAVVGFLVSLAMFFEARRAEKETQLTADQIALDYYIAEANELWPAREKMIPVMLDWLRRARDLASRLGEHERHLGELEDELQTLTADDDADRESLAALQLRLERKNLFIEALDAFVRDEDGALYSVPRRVEDARSIHTRSVVDYQTEWDEAIVAIEASDKYGFRIDEQVSLVPLGFDPESRLYEFAQIETGEIPRRVDGKLQFTEESALVFVLLPGGEAHIGAQSKDPEARNYYEGTEEREGPVQTVTLAPFLLSKYEVTQAQWIRFTGRNPSNYKRPPLATPLHPVELVSWDDCVQVLKRFGLELPTETQWEYGCRAGSSGPWCAPRAELDEFANLADRTAKKGGARWPELDLSLEDGFIVHGPVGSLRANDYGLHDVHGNVWEWCRGGFTENYKKGLAPGDGEVIGGKRYAKIVRGGSHMSNAHKCRSAYRFQSLLSNRVSTIGVRPSRSLDGWDGS